MMMRESEKAICREILLCTVAYTTIDLLRPVAAVSTHRLLQIYSNQILFLNVDFVSMSQCAILLLLQALSILIFVSIFIQR